MEAKDWDPFWTGDREPEPELVGPPTGSTKEVLAWVGTDLGRAQEALDAEIAGQQRKGVFNALSELLNENG